MKRAIELLEDFLKSLPKVHHEVPGVIRSIEVLKAYGDEEVHPVIHDPHYREPDGHGGHCALDDQDWPCDVVRSREVAN